jgi:tetratricopeptide (TPR) repeat protein
MRRIDLMRCLGMAFVACGALAVAGCQQLHLSRSEATKKAATETPEPQPNLTAAQQADVQIAMGRVTENQGDLAGAMAAYQQALGRDQKSAEAHARMAVVHDKQGEYRESAELYRKALKLSPGNAAIYCDMGYSLYLQRRWAEAEMNLRQAITLNANLARAHNNLAMLLVRDMRVDAALEEFRKGGSDEASAHANVAFVLTTDNRLEEARKHYEFALAANPSSREIKERLMQLDTLIARLDRRPPAAPARDERLAKTSSEPTAPPSRPAADIESREALPRRARAADPVLSQRRVKSPFDEAARATPFRTRERTAQRRPVPLPVPDAPDAPESAPVAPVSQPLAPMPAPTPSAPPQSIDLVSPQKSAEPVDIAPRPSPMDLPHREDTGPAEIDPLPSPDAVTDPQLAQPGTVQSRPRIPRPRTYIPPPREIRPSEIDQPDGSGPAEGSNQIIPPPRKWSPTAQPEADKSPDSPSTLPVAITAPKVG